MSSWKRLLVPLDGSELSAWALSRAKNLLDQPDVSVTLLHVIEAAEDRARDLAFQVEPRHREAHDRLAALRDQNLERSIPAHAEIRFGDPATEILREISAGGHDLVAMTTHGRSGLARVMFGSVALKVLQASPAPLLLFHPLQRPDETLSPGETSDPARFWRLLVPLDGSPAGEEILPAAEGFAETFGSKLHLFMAIPGGADEAGHRRAAEEYLDRLQARLGARGPRPEIQIRTGSAGEEALGAIRDLGLDGVAMTTHGRSGVPRALYGSVAERILREARVPVLLLRNRRMRRPLPAADLEHRPLGVD
jgi:nucleotide-binding universal stress UspA family protein